MEKSYRYVGYFMLLLIPLVFAGFYKTYIQQIPDFSENITTFIHIHAVIATLWIAMLILQPFLILRKQFALHRKVGKLSYLVFPLLILSFVPQMLRTVHSEHSENLFYPLADCLLLIVFYTLAIYNRKISSNHMRYMIATALVFLGPTIGRIGPVLMEWTGILTQNIQYAIIYMVLIILILYDKYNRKKYYPYLFALACFAVHQAVFYLVFL